MRTNQVAPYTGAWIEIYLDEWGKNQTLVAPYTGAWIEIVFPYTSALPDTVAPYTGAWIEIYIDSLVAGTLTRRTLHGCVD